MRHHLCLLASETNISRQRYFWDEVVFLTFPSPFPNRQMKQWPGPPSPGFVSGCPGASGRMGYDDRRRANIWGNRREERFSLRAWLGAVQNFLGSMSSPPSPLSHSAARVWLAVHRAQVSGSPTKAWSFAERSRTLLEGCMRLGQEVTGRDHDELQTPGPSPAFRGPPALPGSLMEGHRATKRLKVKFTSVHGWLTARLRVFNFKNLTCVETRVLKSEPYLYSSSSCVVPWLFT